jgi:hypothetical protein
VNDIAPPQPTLAPPEPGPGPEADTPSRPRAALWEAAREALVFMQTLFGGPAAIAALVWVVGARRAEMLAWLAPVERLARKLVALEAASLAPPPLTAPPLRQGAQPSAPRARRDIDIETPQDWPARFCVSAPQERRRLAGPATPPRSVGAPNFDGLYPAFAIAARLEALRRVVEDPAPYVRRPARRLARRLARTPGLLAALARPASSRAPCATPCATPCSWALAEAELELAIVAGAQFSADTS